MSGLTRQEMKRDEVREGLIKVVDWIAENVQKILLAIGALILLLIGFWAVSSFLESRQGRAQEQLTKALAVVSAPILEEGATPDSEDAPSFASEEARAERARELLTEISPGTDAGAVASVYLGDLAAKDGQMDEARELWNGFIKKYPRHSLAAMVESSIISLDREQGRTEELIGRLRALDASGKSALPRDVLLYELGLTLEESGETQDAADTYKTLTEEFPQSPYSQRARTRPSFALTES